MSNQRRLMLVLFALALGLRVLYPAIFGEQTALSEEHITTDFTYATTIAHGFEWIGTPESPRSPGYPIVLALFYLAAGKQIWLMIFFQAILGALTVVLVYRVADQILGITAGTLAALWYAFSISHIRATGNFHRDILAVFLIILLLFLLTRPFQRMLFGVITGIVYGALVHVEPMYILLFPVFVVVILFKTRHPILNVQYLFIFAAIAILFCVPWAVRNGIVYGQPIPVGLEAERYLAPARIAAGDDERLAELSGKIVLASKSGRIEQNVVEFWRFARFRDGKVMSARTGEVLTVPAWSLRYNLASIVTYGILLPFFLLGLILALRSRHRTLLLLLFFTVCYAALRAYFNGSVRTRMPVDPLIVITAFYAILWLKQRLRPRREKHEET